MSCTTYNDTIGYDASIPYNGICVSPSTHGVAGYGGGRVYNYVPPKIPDDDEIIVLMLLELDDD